MDISTRHDIEERFHDQHAGESNVFWDFTRPMFEGPEACLRSYAGIANAAGRSVLEIGCGDGVFTLELLRSGARVAAIDISETQIEVARRRVAEAGFAEKIVFYHLGAEAIAFDGVFDSIVGKSILHHLDLRVVAPRIARALRPGGTATFIEPLEHNPFLNLGRKMTPYMRTPTERPLALDDIREFSSHFTRMESTDFHVLSLLSFFWYYVIKNRLIFAVSTHVLSKLDQLLFKAVPFVCRYAWITVLRFEKGLS